MNPLEKRFAGVFDDGQLVRMIFSNKRKKCYILPVLHFQEKAIHK